MTQKSHYKVIDGSELSNLAFRNDNIAILNAEDLDSSEKLEQVFKRVNVVVTTDLDLKGTHENLKDPKYQEIFYFKSIILLESHDFTSLKEVLTSGVKFKTIDTKSMDEHEVLVKELETYCGFEKSKLDEIFKDKEKEAIQSKVSLLVQA